MMFIILSDIYILSIKNADYHCIISGISKSEDIKLLKILIWLKKVERYKKCLSRAILKAVNLLKILI